MDQNALGAPQVAALEEVDGLALLRRTARMASARFGRDTSLGRGVLLGSTSMAENGREGVLCEVPCWRMGGYPSFGVRKEWKRDLENKLKCRDDVRTL